MTRKSTHTPAVAAIRPPHSKPVRLNEQAREATHLAQLEAERLQHRYLGPEHLLLALLRQDSPAARLLHANGLDLEHTRADADRLADQGVLPRPRPSDAEVLATVGVDLQAVRDRLIETFGGDACYYAAQRVHLQPRSAAPWAGMEMFNTPTLWRRAIVFAAREAGRRGRELGPEHLLFGLLLDARDPAGTDLYPNERREHAYLGQPVRGPHPVRLLIEARGASLETLLEAVRSHLDQDTARPTTQT
jgi:Clp amino terminal domain, pathogenicity island component